MGGKDSSRGLWFLRQSFSVCEESSGSICLRVRVRGLLYRFLEWRGVPNMVLKVRVEFTFLALKKNYFYFLFFFWFALTGDADPNARN